MPVLRVFGELGRFKKTGRKHPNHWQLYAEIIPNFSTPHFASNEVLFKCKSISVLR